MSKKFKIIALSVALVLMATSTFFGVWAAQKASSIPFGENIAINNLDTDEQSVGMINFLLLGVDDDGTRTDTMMLASVDGYSNRVSILSIPRDTRVKINGYYQKINAAIGAGISEVEKNKMDEPEEMVIKMVKELTGLPIHYFMTVNFDGFMEIIEVLDGVEFNVPYNMDYDDPVQGLHIHLEKGQQHLNGQQAHDFVRFRHNNDGSAPGEYVMGDLGRIHWQQEFVKELLRQKMKPQYFSKIDDIFSVINDNVRTNYTMTDLMKHMKLITSLNIDEITTYQLPGDTEYIDELWWFLYDEGAAAQLVTDVFMPRSREEWEAQLAEKAAQETAASASPGPTATADPDEE